MTNCLFLGPQNARPQDHGQQETSRGAHETGVARSRAGAIAFFETQRGGWRAGTRLLLYTGFPSAAVWDEDREGRTAPYWRLDWRVQKRWPLGDTGGFWAFTAEILNATVNQEQVAPDCVNDQCAGETIGPVTVPSLGVEAAF